eukprot:Opistho-1_new@65255
MARVFVVAALLALIGYASAAPEVSVFSDPLDNRAGTLILAGSNYTVIPFFPGGVFPIPTFSGAAGACAQPSQYAAAYINTNEDRPYVMLSFDIIYLDYAEFYHTAFAFPGSENPSFLQNKLYLLGCSGDKNAGVCRLGVKEATSDLWVTPTVSATVVSGKRYSLRAVVRPGQANSLVVVSLYDKESNALLASTNGTFGQTVVRKFGVVYGGKTAAPVCATSYLYYGGNGEADKTVIYNDTLTGVSPAAFWSSLPQNFVGDPVPYLSNEGACGVEVGVMVNNALTSDFGSQAKSLRASIEYKSRNASQDAAGVYLMFVGMRRTTNEWVVLKAGCEYTSYVTPTGVATNCMPSIQIGDDCQNRVQATGNPIRVSSGYTRLLFDIRQGMASLTVSDPNNPTSPVGSASTNGWEAVFAEVNFNLAFFQIRPSYNNNMPSNVEKCAHNFYITASDPVQFNSANKTWPASTPCNGNPNPNPNPNPGNCTNVSVQCLGNYVSLVDVQSNRILFCSRSTGVIVNYACFWSNGGSSAYFRTADLSTSSTPMAEHTVSGTNGMTFGMTRGGLVYRSTATNGAWVAQAYWDCPAQCAAP